MNLLKLSYTTKFHTFVIYNLFINREKLKADRIE